MMKSRYRLWGVCAGLLAMLWMAPVFAEPSLHQVYEAAESGQMGQAQQMMSEVLKAHPSSGKAHYVEAELLAKQHNFSQARRELALAERLSPGLNFTNQYSVAELRRELSTSGSRYTGGYGVAGGVTHTRGFPLGSLIFGALVVGVVLMLVMFLVRRRSGTVLGGMSGGGRMAGYGGSGGPQPVSPYPGYPPQGGGLGGGSGILGSLATGAAMGAGVVAGEALMDRILDGGERRGGPGIDQGFTGGGMSDDYLNNDMGGADFGIADSGWGGDQDFGMDSSDDWS